MACLDLQEEKDKVSLGVPLTKSTKKFIIAQILQANPLLAADVIAHFEPRLAVNYDSLTGTLHASDAGSAKLRSKIYAASEDADEKKLSDEAGHTQVWHDEKHDVKHMANTELVNAFLRSIPLINRPKPGQAATPQSKRMINPVQAKDLLWWLAKDYPGGYTMDIGDLYNLLNEPIQSQSIRTTDAEDDLLFSMRQFLFSPGEVVYKDIYNKTRSRPSIFQMAFNGPSLEVRTRAQNQINSLINTIASVNDFSYLSHITPEDVFHAVNDGVTEHRSALNRSIVNKIFDTDTLDGKSTLRFSKHVLDGFKDTGLLVRQNNSGSDAEGYTLSLIVNEKDRDGYNMMDSDGNPRRTRLQIPFQIETSRRNDVARVELRNFLDSGAVRDPALYSNPHVIKQLFDLAGYGDVMDSASIYNDYINNPKNGLGLNELYQLATNGLLSLASGVHTQVLNDKTPNLSPFEQDSRVELMGGYYKITNLQKALGNLRAAMVNVYGSDNRKKDPRNITKTLKKAFAGELDISEINAFIPTPTMFHVGNSELIKQLIVSRGLYRNQSQVNVNNDLVNKNTIISNVENIKSKVIEIQKLGNDSVFANHPLVTGRMTIEGMLRYDGFKSEDGEHGKSQMRMNEREVSYSIMRYFGNSIMESWDSKTNSAYRGDYFPEVNSDKSAFMGHRVRTSHNQFPLRKRIIGGKEHFTVDHAKLFDKMFEEEAIHRQAFANRFVKAWRESGLTDLSLARDINEVIAVIEATPMPPLGDINLLYNKYWIAGENGYFAVKDLVKDYLQPITPELKERRRLETAKTLASYYNENTDFGVSFGEDQNTWLRDLKPAMGKTQLINPQTNQELRGADAGVFVPEGERPTVVAGENADAIFQQLHQYMHPFEMAHFFGWNTMAPPISQLLVGDTFQYSGNNYHDMMRDKLKRSVSSVAPYMRMSIDTKQNLPNDMRVPRTGRVLYINDDKKMLTDLVKTKIPVLGVGGYDKKEVFDGGSLTWELPEIMYQASYGGVHGLFPQASFKFIYPNTDNRTGDNTLVKYALHRVSTEWTRQGTEKVAMVMKLFMGSIPFNRTVVVNSIFGGQQLSKEYGPQQTLYDIFKDIDALTQGTADNPMQVLAGIIASTPDANGRYDLKDKFVSQIIFKSSAKTGQVSMHSWEDLTKRYNVSEGIVPQELIDKYSQELGSFADQDVSGLRDHYAAQRERQLVLFEDNNFQEGFDSFTGEIINGDTSYFDEKINDLDDILMAVRSAPGSQVPLSDQEIGTIDHVDLGMQLDATHDPENTTIAMVSQAITASLLEGRTPGLATEMLNTLQLITKKGIAETTDVFMTGNIRFNDLHRYYFIDGTTGDFDSAAAAKATGNPIIKRKLLKEKSISFKKMNLDSITEPGIPKTEEDWNFQMQDVSFKPKAIRLFKRALALQQMDAQGIYNSTYQSLYDNSFDMQEPSIERTISSAINSFINKRTVGLKFSGGNYVITPTQDLIGVYDALDTQTGEQVTLMKDQLANPRYQATTGKHRNLKWKGYINDLGESIFQAPQWDGYRNAVAQFETAKSEGQDSLVVEQLRQIAINARHALHEQIVNGGYIAQPAEFIMPFSFKTKFGLKAGMQPNQIDQAFFFSQQKKEIQELAFLQYLVDNIDSADHRRIMYQKFGREAVEAIYNQKGEIEKVIDSNTEAAVDNLFTNLFPQMDRDLLVSEMEVLDEQIVSKAQQKYDSFRKALEVLVHRIPNSGQQSIVSGKIVGFIEGNQNAIFIPTELMVIQGADLDIDKSTVQSYDFDSEGNLHEVILDDDGNVDFEQSSVPALKNHITKLMTDMNNDPANAMQSQTPVGFSRLQEQQKKSDKGSAKFDPYNPNTIVRQKILTAEGKAMVGVSANALKMFGITYYVRQATGRPLKPITLNMPGFVENDLTGQMERAIVPEFFGDIANNNPNEPAEQAWEFYSELINAATDNAKEMILGAIGANLQTGNMINSMIMYGMKADMLFDFLRTPTIEAVLKEMRYSNNIYEEYRKDLKPTDAVRSYLGKHFSNGDKFKAYTNSQLPVEELLKWLGQEPGGYEKAQLLHTFLKMAAIADEFGMGASLLAINRQLPVTMFDKYNYAQRIENYVNEKFETALEPGFEAFNLSRFTRDKKYAGEIEGAFEQTEGVMQSVNLVSLLRHTPHINGYLQAKDAADHTMKTGTVYQHAESIITGMRGNLINKYANVSEDQYNSVVRYLNELVVFRFLKDKVKTITMAGLDGDELKLDMSKNKDIAAYMAYFPSYVARLKSENPGVLDRNMFFKTLSSYTDAKGQYLRIPNIDQLGEAMKADLQFSLNHLKPFENETLTIDGQPVPYRQLMHQLFIYSLVSGKATVSKSSFFDLFEPNLKKEYGYTDYLKGNEVLATSGLSEEYIANNATFATIFAKDWIVTNGPMGDDINGPTPMMIPIIVDGHPEDPYAPRKPAKNLSTYPANAFIPKEDLPPFISHPLNGERKIFQLTEIVSPRTGVPVMQYSVVRPMYPTISVSANTGGQRVHTTANHFQKNISDSDTVARLVAGQEVAMKIDFPENITAREVLIDTNIGTIKYNRGDGKAKFSFSRLLGFENKMQSNLTRQGVQNFAYNMVERIRKLYPGIEIDIMNSDQIASEFSDFHAEQKGFVTNTGRVVMNMDLMTIDTATHELGHLFLPAVKQRFPELYARAMDLALESNNPVAIEVRAKYPELNEDALAEEIFVTMLGFKSAKDMALTYSSPTNHSWILRAWETIKDVVGTIRDILKDVMVGADNTKMLEDLDVSTATLGDLLSSVSWEMLHPDIKMDIDPSVGERFSKVLKSSIGRTRDILTALVGPELGNKSGNSTETEKYAFGRFMKIHAFVKQDFKNENKKTGKRIFSNERSDKNARLARMLFSSDKFNTRTDNIHRLKDLKGKVEIKPMLNGVKSVTVDFGQIQDDYPNMLVKTRIAGGQVELEFIDISNHNPSRWYNKKLRKKNLAGAYVKDHEFKKMGGTYNAVQKDVDFLRMGLLGMSMKETGGTAVRVGGLYTISTINEKEDSWIKGSTMHEAVENINVLAKIDGFGSALQGDVKRMLGKKELLDSKQYRYDLLQYYKTFVDRLANSSSDYLTEEYAGIHDSLSKLKSSEKIIPVLEERMKILMGSENKGHKLTGDRVEQEVRVLSELLLDMNKVRNLHRVNKNEFVNEMQKYVENPGRTGSGIFDFIYGKLLDAMQRVRTKVMLEFKPKHRELQNALIKDYRSRNSASFTEDYTMNDARKFFNSMMERVNAKTEDGSVVKVYTGRVIGDTSTLTKAQKDYLDFFQKQVQEGYGAMYKGKKVHSNRFIPLMKANQSSVFKDVIDKDSNVKLKDAVGRWVEEGVDNLDYFYEDIDSIWVDDRFSGQFDKGKNEYGNDVRMSIMGLRMDKGQLILEDAEANAMVERDLSLVLDLFVGNAHKKAEFDKVVPYVQSTRNFVSARKLDKGLKVDDFTMEMLDNVIDRMVINKSKESENFAPLNKALQKAQGISSMAMLGLNWKANIANFATGFAGNLKEAMFNSLSNLLPGMKDTTPRIQDIAKADALVLRDWEISNHLNYTYGFNQLDMQNMGHSRFRETDMAKFSSKSTFHLNFVGDAYNRNVLFVAQMLRDGSYKAHKMVDGKMVYDETQDGRFFGPGGVQTEQQKALHKAVKEQMRKEGLLDKKGNMTRGYDNKTRNSLKAVSDKIHGSYDSEMASNLHNYALGRLFLMFKKFMMNRVQTYLLPGKGISDIEGRYVEVTLPSGEIVFEWEGQPVEGVFMTLANLLRDSWEMKGLAFKNLNSSQKRNMIMLGTDLVMVTLIIQMVKAMFGEEDEWSDDSPMMAKLYNGTYDAFATGIDPRRYAAMITEPFVTAGWASDMIDNIFSAADGDVGKIHEFINLTPVGYIKVSAQRTQEFLEALEE